MEAAWLQEGVRGKVRAPGWELLLGWEEVQRSWPPSPSQPGKCSLQWPPYIVGDTAWVVLSRNITITQAIVFSSALIETTQYLCSSPGPVVIGPP